MFFYHLSRNKQTVRFVLFGLNDNVARKQQLSSFVQLFLSFDNVSSICHSFNYLARGPDEKQDLANQTKHPGL